MNQRRSSLGMASTKKSWRSIWCSPVQFEDSCHWRHRLSLSGIQNVTNHAISKFREELIKYRSRYIEKVTGNGVLLIAINACLFVMFVEEERLNEKNLSFHGDLARNFSDVNFRSMSRSKIVSAIFIVNDPLQNYYLKWSSRCFKFFYSFLLGRKSPLIIQKRTIFKLISLGGVGGKPLNWPS